MKEKTFKPTSENWSYSYIKVVNIMIKKVYVTDRIWYGVKGVIC
jgi:hypothetical protein